MRILFWCERFHPYVGGVEVVGGRLTAALAARGHQVAVLATQLAPALPREETLGCVRIFREPTSPVMVGRDLAAILNVRRRIAALKSAFRPEVVHLVLHPGAWFQLQTESAAPVPLVLEISGSLDVLPAGADTTVGKLTAAADRVTSVSQAALADVVRRYPIDAGRTRVVYNALPTPSERPGPFPAEPTMLCVGRLAAEKGFDVAVRAMPAVLERFPRARLLVAGDGPQRAALQRLIGDLGLADRAELPGWVAPQDVPELINRATVVLVPSRAECFGLVALEGAQMARPVVASRVGGLPEVVEDGVTGLLTPPDDPQALAQAVIGLLSDPANAEEMGRAGRTRAQRLFRFDRYVDEYESLYRELVGSRAAPRIGV